MKQIALFGSATRTRYLVEIAINGPASGREIGRRLSIDPGSLPDLFRHFKACGVVTRNQDSKIEIDDRFAAVDELLTLLNALGCRRVVVLPNSGVEIAEIKTRFALFGSKGRSSTLIALAISGNALSLSDLALISRTPARSISNTIDVLERDGILQSERIGHERLVSFAPDFAAKPQLVRLLHTIGAATPMLASRVRFVKSRREQDGIARPDSLIGRLPFGTHAQSAVLQQLSMAPNCTADLKRTCSLPGSTVRQVLNTLEALGLIVTTSIGKGRGSERWAALNGKHPLTEPLETYSRALGLATESRLKTIPPQMLKRDAPVLSKSLPGWRQLLSAPG